MERNKLHHHKLSFLFHTSAQLLLMVFIEIEILMLNSLQFLQEMNSFQARVHLMTSGTKITLEDKKDCLISKKRTLKVMSNIFLLLNLKDSTFGTREMPFYFALKVLFLLKIFKC